MVSGSAPGFVIAITCGGDVVFSTCVPKSIPDGNNATPATFVRIVALEAEADVDAAAVVTVSVACTGPAPGVTVDGLKMHVDCGGSAPVLHDSAIGVL